MAEQHPSVSVIVPTLGRRPELLRAAVASIQDQTYPGLVESIVVTDAGTLSLPDPGNPQRRIRVMTNSRRKGAAGARNTGLLAATGDLVALCDDDDEWLPHKLDVQVTALLAAPDVIGAGSGYEQRQSDRIHLRRPEYGRLSHAKLLRTRAFDVHPSTLVFRRERLLDGAGLFDEEIPGSYGEDYDWLLRITRTDELLVIPDPLARVLSHPGSYFAGQWPTIAAAIEYLLSKHPDFTTEARGQARLFGRLAFAYAAMGRRRPALRWAARAVRSDPRQRRSYAALAVSAGMPARVIVKLAAAGGKGL
jgi:glycosyltransferase involved in cell wall biosynthesis